MNLQGVAKFVQEILEVDTTDNGAAHGTYKGM
jgi:hypothetical protein